MYRVATIWVLSLLQSCGLLFQSHAILLREDIASKVNIARRGSSSSASTYGKRQSTVASSSVYDTRFSNVTWDNAAWQLSTTKLDQGHYQSRMSVANGYLGINVAAIGPFFEADTPVNGDVISGWPLFSKRQTFATISGFFDLQPTTNGTNFEWLNQYGGESVISGVPHWGGLMVLLENGQYLDASVNSSVISNFSTSLDTKGGVTMWQFTWSPIDSGDINFDLSYSMFASKLFINQAVIQLQIEPSSDCNVSIVNILDGTSAVRTDFVASGTDGQSIYSAVKPNGIANVTAYIYATISGSPELDTSNLEEVQDAPFLGLNDSSIAQSGTAFLKAGTNTIVTKYVGVASSDGFVDPQNVAKNASLSALAMGYDDALMAHMIEWAEVFPEDSVDNYTFPQNGTLPSDPNIIESAVTAVTNPYYLLQNTISANALALTDNAPIDSNSISVGGLGSDSYAGLVFWDAEIWMQPGLVAAFPQAARQIAMYRVAKYSQAKANTQTVYQSSKNKTSFSSDAAVYPWTSGRFGNCTGTGPCFDYEYHINGDIAQELANYWVVTGDTPFFETTLFPVYNSIATFYSELLQRNGSSYVLSNMTDPDEYANFVDNGGYTMPLIADTLMNANMFRSLFNVLTSNTFDDQAANIFISRNDDAGIINEYTGANGSIAVKQADVVLDTFPLSYNNNYTSEDSLNDLIYYAGKQSLNGPGMTFAIFSIVASAVATSGCEAYTYQQYSEQPYARAPWFQLSEQLVDDFTVNGGTHPAYPFITGIGGANQVVLFGYLGLRLNPSFVLSIDPTLPPQIPYLRYRTFYWHGWPISANANQTHTTLARLSTPYCSANQTFATAPIPVQIGHDNSTTYQLAPNGTLTLNNRNVAGITTIYANIAQCLPVISPDDFQPGQFPFSANDGSPSTKWQPNFANMSQSITVALGSQAFQPVTGFSFDWAQNPPETVTVLFHNSSTVDASAITATSVSNITISAPYNSTAAALVAPYTSNTTNITLQSPVYSGTYATLIVQGNQGDRASNATGATVAEWAIIGTEAQDRNVSAM